MFKAPFLFVGWLAPANGMDGVNPSGSLYKIRKILHISFLRIIVFSKCTTFTPLNKAH